jgi:purine nucleosidase
MTTRIILDTDLSLGEYGSEVDDGFALALALSEPDIAIELITTVSGNTDAATAALLTRKLLEQLSRPDIPVVAGAMSPLVGSPKGASGGAAAEMARVLAANPGELTIVGIGPLTNLALALQISPQIATMVKQVVVMGGVFFGHTHERRLPGEFNFHCDPEAVNVVLGSGIPVRFVGLDVTRRCLLTRHNAEQMVGGTGRFSASAGHYALAWTDRLAAEQPGNDIHGCAMHDPLAVAAVIRPELITWQPAHLHVLTHDPAGRGVAITDLLFGRDAPDPNCLVASDVQADSFVRYFLDQILTF